MIISVSMSIGTIVSIMFWTVKFSNISQYSDGNPVVYSIVGIVFGWLAAMLWIVSAVLSIFLLKPDKDVNNVDQC